MLRRSPILAVRALRCLAARGAVGAAVAPAARAAIAPAARLSAAPWTRSFASSSDWEEDDLVIYPDPVAVVGSPAPRWKAPAAVGGEVIDVSLDQYLKEGKYVCLFFYPKDFTFVCPTEIIAFNDRAPEFAALNCQLIAASTDTPESHLAWTRVPRSQGGLGRMDIPLMADVTKSIAARYGCLLEDLGIAARGLYIISPDGVLLGARVGESVVTSG